jgi:hypothetical protein
MTVRLANEVKRSAVCPWCAAAIEYTNDDLEVYEERSPGLRGLLFVRGVPGFRCPRCSNKIKVGR